MTGAEEGVEPPRCWNCCREEVTAWKSAACRVMVEEEGSGEGREANTSVWEKGGGK